ncbi:MAG: SGNH/GDSL hydrolase family protein [Bacteroidaceae bacterium]|nr:SGNH/GDSL hydrolase family protein [Bacteroidaceae bacterium]
MIDKEGRGNVFNASTIIEGYKFNDVDGRYFQSNSAFFTTQPISVRGYDKIIIYNNFSNTWPRNTILYKDGEILAQYNTATAQGQARPYPESSFILRDNSIGESGVKICYLDVSEADEIAMSFDNRVITGWEVDGQHKDSNLAIYRTCGEYFTPFIDTYKERTGNESISSEFLKDIRYYPTYFSGKKIAAIGDSITQGYTLVSYERPWPFFIGSNYNANMLNYGIGGSELAVFQLNELQEYDMTYNPMCIRYAGMDDDAELVLVAGGTNDWSHGHTALGQFGDTTVLTFYGALDVMCKGLLAKYPGKDIIFITPIKRWPNKGSMVYYEPNNLGYTLTDFVDAIKKVCAFYGIPVIDLYEKCPINPLIDEIYDAYLPDGTHPNFAGQRLMSRYITGGINGLISDIREL